MYGASEGLRTVLLEREAPGGQAGTSSRIENYLGFPSGVSGGDLARRAATQAARLGAEILTATTVTDVKTEDNVKVVTLDSGAELRSHAVLIASGMSLRKLSAGGIFLFAFSITFAAFDWLMSLEPTWFSTIFGVYVFSGMTLAALAALGLLAPWTRAGVVDRPSTAGDPTDPREQVLPPLRGRQAGQEGARPTVARDQAEPGDLARKQAVVTRQGSGHACR